MGGADRVNHSCACTTAFELQGRSCIIINLPHNLFATSGFEHAAVHYAIGIHKLTAEGIVLHQVAEKVVHVCTCTCVQHICKHT